MNTRDVGIYVISTAVLAAIGFTAVGLLFAAMFLQGRVGFIGYIILIGAFLTPGVGAYFVVKKMGIVWWYPAAVSIVPGLGWFIHGLLEPHTNPTILLLPIFLLLLLTLPTGRAAHVRRSKVPDKRMQSDQESDRRAFGR